ncbi:MAG: hypothetical protein HY689_07060 [Chloroflexi bacterium]|nr:hypothetical protein [Chloroflexota bacterium]
MTTSPGASPPEVTKPSARSRRGLITVLLVGLGYALAALAFTWPLAAHFTTHVPSDGGDAPYFVWNLWWVRHALVDLRQSPLVTDSILYPQQVSLAFHTLTLWHGLVALPLLAVTSPVVASNLLVLASFVLSGLGVYSLARYEGRSQAAAVVAGFIFAFCPYVFAQVQGHYNLSATWPLPWYALLLLGTLDGRGLRWAAGAGVLLGLLALNDYQYHAFALLLTVVALGYRRWTEGTGWLTWTLAQRLAVMVAVNAALAAPLLVPAVQALRAGLDPTDSLDKAAYFSADLTAWLTPSAFRWGGRPAGFRYEEPAFAGVGTADTTVFLGYTALGLALLGSATALRRGATARERRRAGLWMVCALAFVLLALGPLLHLAGQTTFTLGAWSFRAPLPYLLLSQVPYLGSTRVPARLSIMAVLGVALLASWGFDALRALALRRLARQRGRSFAGVALLAAVPALITSEVALVPMRLESLEVPPFYATLAADGEDYALLELPFGQAVGPHTRAGQTEAILQYYQVVHRKRLLNGFVARERAEKALFFTTLPGLRWLLHPEAGPPDAPDRNREAVRRAVQALDIRYALVHPRLFQDVAAKSRVQDYLEQVLDAGEVYRDEHVVAYRIGAGVRRPPSNAQVRLVSPEDGSAVERLTPTLRWAFDDPMHQIAEVQVSADRDFGSTSFLYWETKDAVRNDPPHSYRIPEAFPLRPGVRYYWRVRPVVDGRPHAWSAVHSFMTPAA